MFWKPCSGKVAWLGNHPSLANREGASVEVAKARCQCCFSKVCLQFSPCEHRSLQQRQLPKNYIQLWDSMGQLVTRCIRANWS